MLCDPAISGNFFLSWMALTVMGLMSTLVFSGILFRMYYVNPTYEMWRWKSNKKYPTPEKVRDEVFQMMKGILAGTMMPAAALYFATTGHSKAYCGMPHGVGYEVLSFMGIWVGADFFEWGYHCLGHKSTTMWGFHRAHHVFFNPSPFAVIADEYVDMLMRSAPMLLIPLIVPINIELLFFEFAVFFYGYGTYLHWGYETPWLSAHNPIVNTSFQHYLHHAISAGKTPYHTGFFFKIWDQLAGTTFQGECFCCECEQKKGKRSLEDFKKVVIPDYSVLVQPSFWFNEDTLRFDATVNDVIQDKQKNVAKIQ